MRRDRNATHPADITTGELFSRLADAEQSLQNRLRALDLLGDRARFLTPDQRADRDYWERVLAAEVDRLGAFTDGRIVYRVAAGRLARAVAP